MTLYDQRRRRTTVLQLDASQTYRRVDVVTVVTQIVGITKVEAVGQLQNNSTWEVVFRDVYVCDVKKTCYTVFGAKHLDLQNLELKIDNKTIHLVESCKYLGVIVR